MTALREAMYKSLRPLDMTLAAVDKARLDYEREVNSGRFTKSLTLILNMMAVHMIVRSASYLRSMQQVSYRLQWYRQMHPKRLVSRRRQALPPGVKRQANHNHTHPGKLMTTRSHLDSNNTSIH